jgi:hypothetical protein
VKQHRAGPVSIDRITGDWNPDATCRMDTDLMRPPGSRPEFNQYATINLRQNTPLCYGDLASRIRNNAPALFRAANFAKR